MEYLQTGGASRLHEELARHCHMPMFLEHVRCLSSFAGTCESTLKAAKMLLLLVSLGLLLPHSSRALKISKTVCDARMKFFDSPLSPSLKAFMFCGSSDESLPEFRILLHDVSPVFEVRTRSGQVRTSS